MSDCRKRRNNARVLAGVVAFCCGVWGCGAANTATGAALVIECVPDDALVSIDGDPVITLDRARDGFVPAPAGTHRLEISAAGYLPFRTVIELVAGAVYDVRVELWPAIEELDD